MVPKHRRKRRRQQHNQPKGSKITRYVDPSVISDPRKRAKAEAKLAKQQPKEEPRQKVYKSITVRLVLRDGKVIEHETYV
jgi:hypothetical protein